MALYGLDRTETTINPADLQSDFFNDAITDDYWATNNMLNTAHPPTPTAETLTTTAVFLDTAVFPNNDPTWGVGHDDSPFEDLFGAIRNNSPATNTPSPVADPVFSQANSPRNSTRRKSRTGSCSPAMSNDMSGQELKSTLTVVANENWNNLYPIPDALHIPQSMDAPHVHIKTDKCKTRAETQIKILLTLDPLDHRFEYIHFPRQLLAKPKLLANADEIKDIGARGASLHMELFLVCAMAMEKPERLEEALRRARGEEPFPHREPKVPVSEMDKDDPAHPQNGGEVIICDGCKEREKKRYDRKKKRAEDEQEWWKYESARVIMINEKEYKKWNDIESGDHPFSPQAKQVEFAMRIACYCRHQEEKTPAGYRVIFTFKDDRGAVVAQQTSETLLITDDHKNKEACNELPRLLTDPQAFMPANYSHPNVVPLYQYNYNVDPFHQSTMPAFSQPSTPLMPNFQQPLSPALDGHFPQSNTQAVPQLPLRPANHAFLPSTPIANSFVHPQSRSYFDPPMLSPSNQASPETYLPRPVSMENFNFNAGMHYGHQGFGSAPVSAVGTPITLSRPASPSWDQGPQGPNKKKMLKPSWMY